VPAPAQPLGPEELVDAAALDRDPLALVQVRRQPVQRPGRERQVQCPGIGQRGGDHGRDLLGRIGRRPARARPILQPGQARGVEPLDPAAHGVGVEPEAFGDGRRALAPARIGDDAGALDPPGRRGTRVRQLVDGRALFRRQLSQSQYHGAPLP
jgi:hypothetical protein